MRVQSGASRAKLLDRVDELEDDLCRMSLLVHALTEACIKKGVLTREEISAMAQQVDLLDGQADGKLDPAALDSSREPRAERHRTPGEHLQQLEKQGQQTPREFLADLEQDATNKDSAGG
jgi:hypothetical protein